MRIVSSLLQYSDEVELGTSRVHIFTGDGNHFVIRELDGRLYLTSYDGWLGIFPQGANAVIIAEIVDGKIKD